MHRYYYTYTGNISNDIDLIDLPVYYLDLIILMIDLLYIIMHSTGMYAYRVSIVQNYDIVCYTKLRSRSTGTGVDI